MTDNLLQAVTLVGQPSLSAGSTSTTSVSSSGDLLDVASAVSSSSSSRTSKLLRIAAFGPALPSPFEYSFRIYVVMDTGDALQARTDDDVNLLMVLFLNFIFISH